WLAASGIEAQSQVKIVIVPPPLMPDAIAGGAIDGYCVGEPWNTAAAIRGIGRIATVKAMLWRSSPEKVLGVSAKWASEKPQTLAALLRAIWRAAHWCGQSENLPELAAMLASDNFVAKPVAWLMPALTGSLATDGD